MRKRNFIYIIIIYSLLISASFVFAKIETDTDNDGLSDHEEQKVYSTDPALTDTDNDGYPDALEIFRGYSPLKGNAARLLNLSLDVVYIHESPDYSWTGPWKNGCEEASIAMVENYYLGKKEVGIKESMDFMMTLFDKQDEIWGSNADADAYRTARLINDYTNYNAAIKDNPTIEQIKKELQQKRPVIVPVYGKVLNNPNTPFLATGSYYHMIVIVGYNDTTNEFITHDNGDTKTGKNYRYKYDILMDALHDFDFSVGQANGPSRAIFTYPKLAKLTYSPKVYYLQNKTKQWIFDEKAFNARGWDWNAINIVRPKWLNSFETGADIK